MTPAPECSYFIDIILDTGQPSAKTQVERLLEAIRSEPELDVFQASGICEYLVKCELENGTIPETDGVEEAFTRIAGKFPGSSVWIRKRCEEPYTPDENVKIKDNKETKREYSRMVKPGHTDPETERVCANRHAMMLREAGFTEAADFLEKTTRAKKATKTELDENCLDMRGLILQEIRNTAARQAKERK